ncbi:MAG: hypothetical protein AB7Q17_10100 [Phycisphaerae bacterium]
MRVASVLSAPLTILLVAAATAHAEDPPVECGGRVGPDLIVGEISGVANYSADGEYEALALGADLSNVGSTWVNWFAFTNQHPVNGGNLFRYRVVDGVSRFEQLGQSWLKHAFFALSTLGPCTDCQPTDGTHLGVNCTDPSTASRGGTQSGLGPKWQVNPHTGVFPYPPANPAWSGSTARRIRVAIGELEPAHSGNGDRIRYYGEQVCIAPDDAADGNGKNNASHRRLTVAGSGTAWSFSLSESTQRQRAAIYAWQDADPGVSEVEIDVPEVGPHAARMILAYKVTPLAGGRFDYEYALYNQNSDRAANSFSVPTSPCVAIDSYGFHDVDYHSGDGPGNLDFDGTDWAFARVAGAATWRGPARESVSGNALRWGTLYNFRFVCDAAPVDGLVDVGLFKAGDAGDPDAVRVRAAVPAETVDRRGDADCDGDVDNFDIDAFVLALAGGESAWAAQYSCGYFCACDVNRDGVVNNFDIDPFVACLVNGACP